MAINLLLKVRDSGITTAFYQKLGFELKMYFKKDGVMYYCELFYANDPDNVLMFLQEEWWDFEDSASEPGLGVIIYVPVNNIYNLHKSMHKEISIHRGLEEKYYGMEFLIKDPDGYKIAIFQPYPYGERLMPGMEIWTK